MDQCYVLFSIYINFTLKKRERRIVYYGYLQYLFEDEIIAWVGGGEVNLQRKINNTNLYNEI